MEMCSTEPVTELGQKTAVASHRAEQSICYGCFFSSHMSEQPQKNNEIIQTGTIYNSGLI